MIDAEYMAFKASRETVEVAVDSSTWHPFLSTLHQEPKLCTVEDAGMSFSDTGVVMYSDFVVLQCLSHFHFIVRSLGAKQNTYARSTSEL